MTYTNDDNNLTFFTSSRSMGSLGVRNEDPLPLGAEEKKKSAHKFYRITKIMTYTKLMITTTLLFLLPLV